MKFLFETKFRKKAPKNETIRRIVAKWNTYGTVHHVKANSGRPKSIRNKSNIDKVRQTFEEEPGLSLRRGAQVLNVPQTSLRRILIEDLRFKPFKVMDRQMHSNGG